MHLWRVLLQLFVLLIVVAIIDTTNRWEFKTCQELTTKLEEVDKKYTDLLDRVEKLERKKKSRKVKCPGDYVSYGNSCFLFVMGKSDVKTWYSAQETCSKRGGNLLTVPSEKLERFVRRYLRDNMGNRSISFYTGLILTDFTAQKPAELRNDVTGDSLRWTATREAVTITLQPDDHVPVEPVADWSPKEIEGFWKGSNSQILPCVIMVWDHERPVKEAFKWRYHVCSGDPLNFICEIRLRRARRRPKRVSKRRIPRSPSDPIDDFHDDEERAMEQEEVVDDDDDDDDERGADSESDDSEECSDDKLEYENR